VTPDQREDVVVILSFGGDLLKHTKVVPTAIRRNLVGVQISCKRVVNPGSVTLGVRGSVRSIDLVCLEVIQVLRPGQLPAPQVSSQAGEIILDTGTLELGEVVSTIQTNEVIDTVLKDPLHDVESIR